MSLVVFFVYFPHPEVSQHFDVTEIECLSHALLLLNSLSEELRTQDNAHPPKRMEDGGGKHDGSVVSLSARVIISLYKEGSPLTRLRRIQSSGGRELVGKSISAFQ